MKNSWGCVLIYLCCFTGERYFNLSGISIISALVSTFLNCSILSVKYTNLQSNKKQETSAQIKQRVDKARQIQRKRYKEYNIFSNSELTPSLIEKFCKLNTESEKLLQIAFERLGLSARAYTRILKVARTIADLEGTNEIETRHVSEAIQYRSLDRKYWKKYFWASLTESV